MSTPTITNESILTKRQRAKFGPQHFTYYGEPATITAEVRYDDDCGNGHNTFSITADIYSTDRRKRDNGWLAGGCCHEEIAKAFPKLAPLIKWHLCSSDGPMHGVANAVYFASERDCWGKLKGEPKSWATKIQFGENPIKHNPDQHGDKFVRWLAEAGKVDPSTGKPAPRVGPVDAYDFEVLPIYYENRPGETYNFGPKYTFGGYGSTWYDCPFDTEQGALNFLYALQHCEPKFVTVATAWGEGKERELDKARHAAIWPDATDEELTAPGLKERLEARLPALLAEFRAAVESLGFTW